MSFRTKYLRAIILSAVLGAGGAITFLVPPAGYSQGITTGALIGTATDQTGAVLPNVTITVVNEATGAKSVQKSRSDGGFSLYNLPFGRYTITFSAPGFADTVQKDVAVLVGETRDLGGVALKPSGAQTTIEVTAASSELINTTEAQVSTNFDTAELANLPLNNGFDAVTLLIPGVVQTHDNNFSNQSGATFSVNGQRGRSNNFEIDGQSNNDNSVAGPQVFFGNQDALAGIQVITNDFSAQYGRNMGGVVNYLTKSGTNSVHGTAFDFNEGNWGEAFLQSQKNVLEGYCAPGQSASTGCLTPTLARFVENRVGGTIGAPIIKDKLWGFASIYFDRSHQGAGTYTSGNTAPFLTPDSLTALSAAGSGNGGVASLVKSGPYSVTTGNPTPGAIVKTGTLLVNDATVNVNYAPIIRQVGGQYNDEELMGRIDWQPDSKDHVFLRYFYQDNPNTGAYADGTAGDLAAGKWYDLPGTTHSIGGDITHTFSPSWVNQIRYSFQQAKIHFQGGAQPDCTVNTPTACNASISLGSGYQGYGYGATMPQGRTVKVTQVQNNATWTHGHHSIAFGGEWSLQISPNPFLPDYNGAFTATDPQSFLDGVGTLNLADGNYTIHFTEPDAAAYLQDDWKVSENLTLNLGVRWEFFGQAVNLLHDETASREANPATAFWDTTLPVSARSFASVPNNFKNFQPRLGFAYAPAGASSRFVVRGGFAINFDPEFYNMFLNSATAAPVVNLGTVNCATDTNCLSTNGTTGADFRAQDLSLIPRGVNPNTRNQTTVSSNFHNPYAESYNLGVEWGPNSNIVFGLRYTGNHAVGLFQSLNANPNLLATAEAYPNVISPSLFCTDTTAIGYGRPNCDEKKVRERANTAFSIYNGLQFNVTTRDYHHLTGTFAYTYSRTIDNSSEVYGTLGGGNTIAFAQNPFDSNVAERGVSGNSIPHVLSASFNYDSPFFEKQHGVVGKVLGGYHLSGVWTYDTGQPVTPYQFGYGYYGYTGMATYCDDGFAASFNSVVSTCRPVLSNKKASSKATGIYLNADSAAGLSTNTLTVNPGYYTLGSVIDYQNGDVDGSGNAINPVATTADSVKWLYNNTDLADLLGNPFPGVGRNTLRANGWDSADASITKKTTFRERYSLELMFSAYNVFNHRELGTADAEVDDVLYGSTTFWDNNYNGGSNARQVQMGARIIF